MDEKKIKDCLLEVHDRVEQYLFMGIAFFFGLFINVEGYTPIAVVQAGDLWLRIASYLFLSLAVAWSFPIFLFLIISLYEYCTGGDDGL